MTITAQGDNAVPVLAEALAALRNGRAWLVLAATFALAALAIVMLGALSSWLVSRSSALGGLSFLLSSLIWTAMTLVGTSAAAMLLTDDVAGRERRSVGAAVGAALSVAPRLVVVILLAIAAVLAAMLLIALLLLICRIPIIGAVFYAVLFPLASVAMGVLVFLLGYALLPMAAPCIWQGDDIATTLATLMAMVRHRLSHLLLRMLMLIVLVAVVGAISGAVVFGGAGIVSSLSLTTIGVGEGASAWGMSAMTEGGYGVAFGFGMLVVMLLATLPPMLLALKGVIIVHRDIAAGLEIGNAATEGRQALDRLIERLRTLRPPTLKRKPAIEEATAGQRVCPNAECGRVAGADELFCTACGERLK